MGLNLPHDRHESCRQRGLAKLSRAAVLWALKSVALDRLSIVRVADWPGASWPTLTSNREESSTTPSWTPAGPC